MEQLSNDQINALKELAKKDFDKFHPSDAPYWYYKFEESTEVTEFVITGFDSKKDLAKDDLIIIRRLCCKVVDITYRDHPGFFNNPELKYGTFFTAQLVIHST